MMQKRCSGFTMLEILAALVVVAILAAIAIPSYSAYVVRGQRATAKVALQQAAQFLERNYTTTGCYNFSGACTGGSAVAITAPTPANAPGNGGRVTYALTVTFPAPATTPAQSFVLAAAPCGTASGGTCPAGSTFTDSTCGALTIDNTGLRGIDTSGTGTGTPDTTSATASSCWQR